MPPRRARLEPRNYGGIPDSRDPQIAPPTIQKSNSMLKRDSLTAEPPLI